MAPLVEHRSIGEGQVLLRDDREMLQFHAFQVSLDDAQPPMCFAKIQLASLKQQ
jgi:hypothetical protein